MPDATDRACPVCGATFTPYRNGARVQRFCSPTCGSRADVRRQAERSCDECGSLFQPKNGRGRYCSKRCRNRIVERTRPRRPAQRRRRICRSCGAEFRGGPSALYCTEDCRRFKDSPASPVPWAECDWCAHRFVRHGTARKYCSTRCRDMNHPWRSRVTEIVYGECRSCGTFFVRRKGQLGGFCSTGCARKANKNHRKHLQRASAGGESFTLREIAERDGWSCHICGRKVPDREYRARDRDPTLDHLIPVNPVDGGTHTKDNVALAHNRCNWERGTAGVAQLRLVG